MASKKFPNMLEEQEKCTQFIQQYTDPQTGAKKYMDMLQDVANRRLVLIKVSLSDVLAFRGEADFVDRIRSNALHYVKLFSASCDGLLPEPSRDAAEDATTHQDVFLNQRIQRLQALAAEDGDSKSDIPTELTRRFELVLVPGEEEEEKKKVALRQVRAHLVGSLVRMEGIITRITEVKPLMRVCTYICGVCGYESYQTVNERHFTPLAACPSEACRRNQTEGKLYIQSRGSKFVKYQELKLQEMPHEVPVGHVPRSITLRCYGETTRQCKPGDVVTCSGIFLPAPRMGYRAMRAGLTAETYLSVSELVPHKKTFNEFVLTPELEEEVEERSKEKDIYETLAHSIAPEIYGQLDVKKCLLLLLIGGVTRSLPDVTIRGDINVLLMGDPGVAKSQLLKHMTRIAPRCVYTTGKGSSGVGLTAAVVRDNTTGETTLEGGALVLADRGICCIDEFDKMEETDRTAIHEVMEQQTVSIAKAGITTTLNARTSILAAANPLMGRWNPKLSPERNLGLPASLLSRFDLTFILLDVPDDSFDEALARHVTHVHRESAHPPLEFEPMSEAFMRAYISRARQCEPYVPRELTEYIVSSYVGLRAEGFEEEGMRYSGEGRNHNNRQRFCTPRALLSILRLSQALARLHLREEITQADCEEAMRLLEESKRVAQDGGSGERKVDAPSAIYNIIRAAFSGGKRRIKSSSVESKVLLKGFSVEQFHEVLDDYAELGVFQVSRNYDTITAMSLMNL